MTWNHFVIVISTIGQALEVIMALLFIIQTALYLANRVLDSKRG